MLRKIPVIQVALTVVVGSLYSAFQLPFSYTFFISVFIICFIGYGFFVFKKPNHDIIMTQSIRSVLLHLSIFTIFCVYASLFQSHQKYFFPSNEMSLSGFVKTVDRLPNGSSSIEFNIESIASNNIRTFSNISVRLYVDSTLSPFFITGFGYHINAPIAELPSPDNFLEFDYGKNLLRQNVHGIILQKDISSLKLSEPNNSAFYSLIGRIQYHIEHTLIDCIPDLLSQSIARGLILGFRSWIPDDVINHFSLTGTMHVLSVSGLNVAFLTFLIFTPLIRLRKYFPKYGEHIRILVTILCIIFYGYLTSWPIGIVRSTIMSGIFLASSLVINKRTIWSSYSLAVFLVLIYDPEQISEPGFLLSFLAVFGIILLSKFFNSASAVKNTLAVSLTAIVLTSPVTMLYFGTISLTGILANLIIIPLTTLLFLLSMIMVIVSPISTMFAGVYGNSISLITFLSTESIKLISTIPMGSILVGETDYITRIIVFVCPLLGLFILLRKLKYFVSAIVLLGTSITIIYLWIPSKTTVSFLYNGMGDMTAVRTSEHQLIFIDCGPVKSESRRNSAVMRERMQRWGFQSIDFVFITHPHLDHYGGITDTIKPFIIKNIVLGDTSNADKLFQSVIRFYSGRGTKIQQVSGLKKFKLTTTEKIIAINMPFPDGNKNNQSLTIKFLSGHSSVLFMGDSEKDQEQLITSKTPFWFFKSDIFKVSHHGSRTSSTDKIPEYIQPEFAIVSVGRNNKYGLPDEEIIEKWKRYSNQLFETRFSGEIKFDISGANLTMETYR